MSRLVGAHCNLQRILSTHLFGIAANNSGTTFLQAAVARCGAVWSLPFEGQRMPGFSGPRSSFGPGVEAPGMIWAAPRRTLEAFADPSAYRWPSIRKAWYFCASAEQRRASVFFTKSPPFLLQVEALSQHFRNAKFLFMVRNPYAVCEGMCRNFRRRFPEDYQRLFQALPQKLARTAATHVVNCMQAQRRNVERWGELGVFFTYETMCAAPERVASEIAALVPALDDLNLRQKLLAKGYHETLTDMNARQLARLEEDEWLAINRVFLAHEELLAWFGYDIAHSA